MSADFASNSFCFLCILFVIVLSGISLPHADLALLAGRRKQDLALASLFRDAARSLHQAVARFVPQRREPPGRDRFLPPEDFRKLIAECESDPVLNAFVWIAATTGARKGEVLPRKWTQVFHEGRSPHISVPRSKNGRAKRLPLAEEAITALKRLPSYGRDESIFPADRANVRFKGKRDHIWDLRKPFQAACQRAGIKDLRIHDLRHMATSILFLEGVPEAIIRKLTGHRSREMERYERLSPVHKRQTVTRIADVLKATDTRNSEEPDNRMEVIERNGGDDGARTRDLRRDRPAF